MLTNKDILLKLEQMERKMLKQDGKIGRQDNKMRKTEQEIELIFAALKELLNPSKEPRQRIGFKP
ncbi:MAG: hypothetical protein ABIQ56_03040 [Chitinophagaceae bacterium]